MLSKQLVRLMKRYATVQGGSMEDIARELYECLTERIYSTHPASMGASSRERQAMDAFLNRGYEVVKPDAD
jgi:hypothetical protein